MHHVHFLNLVFTSKYARALQREEKNYQTLIANRGRILYMYLCFTLSINFKSSNLSYDDLTLRAGYDDIQNRLFDETVLLI
jgi:hypothetical protein